MGSTSSTPAIDRPATGGAVQDAAIREETKGSGAARKWLADAARAQAAELLPVDLGPSGQDYLASEHSSSKAATPRIVVATPGDHPSIFPFLTEVFQGPSHDAYLSTLDDPFYEPSDRLLVKCGSRILSHLHLGRRVLHFGPLRVPCSVVSWLGTSPEFRGLGYGQRLLQVADQLMTEDGSALGLLRTRIPHFFRAAGWAVCGRHCFSRASTRDLMAQLSQRTAPLGLEQPERLSVRPWRQVELPSLMRLYRDHSANTYGSFERTEPFWRWLISRKGFDQIFVAIEGPDRFELDDGSAPIVGYAATWRDQVIELCCDPNHPLAASQLLARACSEAIERDYYAVTLQAAPDDPLHRVFRVAGGTQVHHESNQSECFMVRIIDPVGFLRMMCPLLHRRAEASRMQRPTELGLDVEGDRLQLVISRRSVKIGRQRVGRSYLSCNRAEFTRLLMGHLDLDEAVEAGRLEASTRLALEIGKVLFCRTPLWRPPLDEMDP